MMSFCSSLRALGHMCVWSDQFMWTQTFKEFALNKPLGRVSYEESVAFIKAAVLHLLLLPLFAVKSNYIIE